MRKIDSSVERAHQWVVDAAGVCPKAIATFAWYGMVIFAGLYLIGMVKFKLWGDLRMTYLAACYGLVFPICLAWVRRVPVALHRSDIAMFARIILLCAVCMRAAQLVLDPPDGLPIGLAIHLSALVQLYLCLCDDPKPPKRRKSIAYSSP